MKNYIEELVKLFLEYNACVIECNDKFTEMQKYILKIIDEEKKKNTRL